MHTLKTLFPSYSGPALVIDSLENDSRCAGKNTLFIAFTGFERDLHQYIDSAYHNGCRAFVISECYQPQNNLIDAVFIPVKDIKAENARLSRLFYGNPDEELCIIAVTGTNGKTTTTSMIEHSLRVSGKKTAFFGTTHWRIGTEIWDAPNTTPDMLPLMKYFRLCVEKGVSHVVLEAASHALVLGRLESVSIDIAVFTNLSQDHLDFHQTMDDYYLAKQSLFTVLLSNSSKSFKKAFINADDVYGQKILRILGERGIPAASFSLEGIGSINAENIKLTPQGAYFTVDGLSIFIPLIGRVNIQNAMAAYGVLKHLGLSSKEIILGLSEVSVKGRMEKIIAPDQTVFLVDYAHTPDALARAIASASSALSEGSKLIVLFGAGGDRDKTKRPIMAEAALGADVIIISSDNPRTENPLSIIDDIVKGIPKDRKEVYIEQDRGRALALAKALSEPYDVVLVAGKGHEEYQIIGREKKHFSDIEEIKKLL